MDSVFQKVKEEFFGIGICLDKDSVFAYSPFWYRKNDTTQFHQLHDTFPNNNEKPYKYWIDSDKSKWYTQLMAGQKWVHPYFGWRAQDWLFEYGVPIKRNCDVNGSNCDTIGIVYADYSPKIFERIAKANSGKNSYAYIVTRENKVIYLTNQRLDLNESLVDLRNQAKDQKDKRSLLDFCDFVVPIPRDTSGVMQYQDRTQAGSTEWRIFSKIKPTYWTYAFIYNTDQIDTEEDSYIKLKLRQIVFILIFLICLTFIILNKFPYLTSFLSKYKLARNTWVLSKVTTLYLALGLIWVLYVINSSWPALFKNNQKTSNGQSNKSVEIFNYESTARYLSDKNVSEKILTNLGAKENKCKDEDNDVADKSELIMNIIQMSMAVNHIDLVSADKIRVAGRIMIKYPERISLEDIVKMEQEGAPFYFSNMSTQHSIEHLSTFTRKIPRKGRNDKVEYNVSNWHFDVVLHQNISYNNYPFDVLPLEIKLHPTFSDREIIIPDFDNYYFHAASLYDQDQSDSLPRIRTLQSLEPNLTINEWDILNGSYKMSEAGFPNTLKTCNDEIVFSQELTHSTLVKRQLFEPLISNFLPIFVIAFIVFIIILRLKTLGIEGIIGTTVGLFFSLLLSHYKLRDDLEVHTVVYMEYYYFLLYIILISFLIDKYFHLSQKNYLLVDYKNNLFAKVIYWPFLLSVMIIMTIVYFVFQL